MWLVDTRSSKVTITTWPDILLIYKVMKGLL